MRPISILIVDDEEFARESIRLKIDRTRFDISRIDEAEDALSAISLVENKDYDIIITDIKMPQMNGLDMIKELQMAHQNLKFIIVSGYNEFEYAREGLRMGVTDYLLKPVWPAQLNNLIAAICEQILSEENVRIRQNELASKIQEQQVLKYSHAINKLLRIENWEYESDINISDQLLSELKVLSDYSARPPFVIAVFQLRSHKKLISCNNLETSNLIRKNLDVCFNNHYMLSLNYRNPQEFIVIHQESKSEKSILFCYRNIISQICCELDCDLVIGLSSVATIFNELPQIYQQSLVACRNKLLFGYNQVICFNDLPVITTSTNRISESEMMHLDNLIKTQRMQEARIVIRDLVRKSVDDAEIYQQLIDRILSIYIVLLRSYSVDHNSELDRVFLQRLYHLDDVESIESLLFEYMEHLFSKQDIATLINGEEIVKQSQKYIQEHYNENISLEALSEIYHIHPNYLSRAYKKYTDYNFNEYLTRIRMEKAILLLRHSTARVQEVSQMLGYTDSKYFSKVFKKYYGITPSQLDLIKGAPERMACDS